MWNRIVLGRAVTVAVIVGASMLLVSSVLGQSAQFANFEGAQTSPLRLSPDGTRLFAVNTSNASVSVFDVSTPETPTLIREIPVGLEPVSVNPRTSDEAWVVNQLSDSVSIVSVSRGIVTDTIRIPDEPMDVVFAGSNQAYVSVSRLNAIAVFDTNTHALTRAIPLFGGNPRALAVSPDGGRVYAAFALSGNGTTLIRDDLAPPPPPPTNASLPPAPQVSKIVSANDPLWSSIVTYRLPDNDVAVITASASPTLAGYYSNVGSTNFGLAVNPATGDIFVANTDARNLVQFQPNLRGHWIDSRITRIQVSGGQITPFDLNPNIDYSVLPNPSARATALAEPTSVVFDPSGQFMYVAAFGTDRVAQVDTDGRVSWFVEVGPPSGSGANADPRTKRGPRGLALNANARTLYALNRISNTISVIDTVRRSVLREILVGTDATPLGIRMGRGFLYDAKLSGNGTGSCASCHVDGDMDHLAWDLGDPAGEMSTFQQGGRTVEFHPMKGPMTTQTLRGLSGLAPFHWRGDRANFLQFNPAFEKLMGGTQLSDADMLVYAGFATTILFQPNPNQNKDRSLPASIRLPSLLRRGDPTAGQTLFFTVPKTNVGVPTTCNGCHKANPGSGTSRLIIGLDEVIQPQPLKIPHLRNVYQKVLFNRFGSVSIDGFGLDHDGHVAHFLDFFASPVFADYTTQEKVDLAAFLMCFETGTAPAVGHTITLTAGNVANAVVQAEWTLLQNQAVARSVDVIVRGTINGRVGGFLYRPSSDDYFTFSPGPGTLSRADVQRLIENGDTLTVMGVYPGTGRP